MEIARSMVPCVLAGGGAAYVRAPVTSIVLDEAGTTALGVVVRYVCVWGVCMCGCVGAWVWVGVGVCMYVYIYIYIYIYIIYMCMHICIYADQTALSAC
jgi:hypothetical protein